MTDPTRQRLAVPSADEMASAFEDVAVEDVREYCIRHSPKPVPTREYFDEVETRKYFVEPHVPASAEFARWNDKKVLEIGCGIGTDTINSARAGAMVTAAELCDESMKVAEERAEVFGLSDRISFSNGNAERLNELRARLVLPLAAAAALPKARAHARLASVREGNLRTLRGKNN
jgi:2-polyprenyl-3-methyl-5-hydroxy-6-metoxy-1,4-benzoquinol methylase